MTRTSRQLVPSRVDSLLTHEEESESSTSVTSSLEKDLGQRLTGDGACNGRDVTQGEHDDD
jgi:hypothetical protein